MPKWLVIVSGISVVVAVASALLVTADLVAGRRQHMWIMNVVWPVTALWSGPLGAWAYFRFGRAGSARAAREAKERGREPPSRAQPFPVLVAKGATHCGSGCTLGDIAAELLFLAIPFTLFGAHLFAAWVYDYAAAFAFGIAFQYFTIKPMRGESPARALRDAFKADALSLTAWQVGMYGWMAVATFAIFSRELRPTSIVFWSMMQVAMIAGFAASYPVNWLLLRKGVKEAM